MSIPASDRTRSLRLMVAVKELSQIQAGLVQVLPVVVFAKNSTFYKLLDEQGCRKHRDTNRR